MPAILTPDIFRVVEHLARALPPADSGFEINDAIRWQETVEPPVDADDFASETVFVICNSGMKHTVARQIYNRVYQALTEGSSSATVFGHAGKTAAIDAIWRCRHELYDKFTALDADAEKLEFLAALPWIGAITKYHLAKNFGVDVAKPDVHLQRLASADGRPVHIMCTELAAETGYRIATVDLILWFACARGVIDSRAPEPFAPFLPTNAASPAAPFVETSERAP